MIPFDPQDWWGAEERGARRGEQPHDPDRDRALVCGLAAATCLCLASFAPPALMPAVAAELLVLASLGSMLEALLRGQALRAGHLTAWDQAAALTALALLLRLLFGGAGAEAVPP